MRSAFKVQSLSQRPGRRGQEFPNFGQAQQEPAQCPAAHRLSEEKHYTPAELASMWHLSPATIRKLIRNEAGVLRLQGLGTAHGKRSLYHLFRT